MNPSPNLEREKIVSQLYTDLRGFGLVPIEETIGTESPISMLRRSRRAVAEDGVGLATLVDEDGVLVWEEGTVTRATPTGMRRGPRRGLGFTSGEPVATVKYEKLGFSDVTRKLEEFDQGFTPHPGLRQYKNGVLQPCAGPVAQGRILLLIHGTFSNNDNLLREFAAAPEAAGMKLLADAERHYDQVLAFDHYTVSRSPMLNALDAARLFARSDAAIDVICHSRGGLVTRWFLEVFDSKPARNKRAVIVGSPLRGTSLAAPDRLRNGLNLMTNLGSALGEAASMVPFLAAAGSLVRIVFSFANLTTKIPLVDAGVAMIPGLAAQSRIENNFELKALEVRPLKPPKYFGVTGNYQPPGVGWKFWKAFCDWKNRAADVLVDRLVFPRDNDMVVDTSSMTESGFDTAIPPQDLCCFDREDHVHHTIYFRQHRTIDFVRTSLGIPMGAAQAAGQGQP